jgi:hypothetical protein
MSLDLTNSCIESTAAYVTLADVPVTNSPFTFT